MKRIVVILALVAAAACSQQADQGPIAAQSASGQDAPLADDSGAAASEAAAAPAKTISRYTTLKDCKLVDAREGEDWSVSRCPGLAGYTVMVNYHDARDDLALRRANQKDVELNLVSLAGGGFNTLSDTIEWRGADAGDGFRPTALIVRNAAVRDPDQPDKPTSLLVVVDLAQQCVIAQVKPQPGQNEAARAIADGPRRACLGRI
ncbi:MAG: hypothetical protein J0M19_16855 [Sphingomonadales bacterium]|nr:hypothetical protein [Sphingomonadales bacterium]